MKPQSLRIFNQILLLIKKYESGDIELNYLLDSLDGSLNALEENIPSGWKDRWLREIIELDTYCALGIEMGKKLEIQDNLQELTLLINEIINVLNP